MWREAAHNGTLFRAFVRGSAYMLVSDIDVWRSAHLLLKQHGKDAAFVAAKHADEAMRTGDLNGVRRWKRIAEAMLELLKAKPGEGEHLH